MKYLSLAILLMLFSMQAFCQKKKNVSAEFVYYAPENLTLDQAKRTALEQAKIQAIADAFGTIVSESSSTMISDINGKTNSSFYTLGGCDVKGEWVETTGKPVYEVVYTDNTLVVKCTVRGVAKEIDSAKTDFVAKVLRNGTDQKFEAENFKSNDELYLYFSSPSAGHIAVYYIDGSETAYCLLPYTSDEDGKAPVKANTEYVFFSEKNAAPYCSPDQVDEVVVTCDGESEVNYLYIIYSPNPFVKASDTQSTSTVLPNTLRLPRQLPMKDFQAWLSRSQNRDSKMQLVKKNLMVTK